MHTARRLSAFVRTNALLANLCDTKKSLRQRDPYAHRRRLPFFVDCSSVNHSKILKTEYFGAHFAWHRFGTALGIAFSEWHRKPPDLASSERLQSGAQ